MDNIRILAEYIWLDKEQYPRSKTKVIDINMSNLISLPIWNFDGSSTGQAEGNNSEVLIKPVKIYSDPIRGAPNILVLCECYNPDMTPHITNTRFDAVKIFENQRVKQEKPWYGIEQEYILLDNDSNRPLGWPKSEEYFPKPQGKYYCSMGSNNIAGRSIVEKHLETCLKANLNVSGINAEVMLGQWEYQIGPCEGINSGDEMIISRYLLYRICEDYGIKVTLEPKPIKGDWNGSGCHTNFSTQSMRKTNGIEYINQAIGKLENNHTFHMENYGNNNKERMTGLHETASYDTFSYGVGCRKSSIRIPSEVYKDSKGYFEDRRPASNMDPYKVTSLLAQTILL